MKRVLTMAAVALLVAGGHVQAQTFQWGIKAGGNLTNFLSSNTSTYNSYSATAGWNAGIFTNFWLGSGQHFAIAPEVLYTTAGAEVSAGTSGNGGSFSSKSHLGLAYVNIPVFAKYKFNGGFYLETGPEISFNVSSSQWQNESVKNLTNGSDFLWGLGLGYQSPIGLGIDLRYNQGLTRVDNVSNTSWDNVSLHNSGFMLDVFWAFFNNNNNKK
ncbi:MAG TPA: porin family protein [Puia sp.]|nr:porin family protein [Puia sp.]